MISFLAGICVLLGVLGITKGAFKSLDWMMNNVHSPILGFLGFGTFCVVVVGTWLFLAALIARGLTASFG